RHFVAVIDEIGKPRIDIGPAAVGFDLQQRRFRGKTRSRIEQAAAQQKDNKCRQSYAAKRGWRIRFVHAASETIANFIVRLAKPEASLSLRFLFRPAWILARSDSCPQSISRQLPSKS